MNGKKYEKGIKNFRGGYTSLIRGAESKSPGDTFYGLILSRFIITPTKNIPTAGVYIDDEGKIHLDYNPLYFETLDIDESKAVLLHEALHIVHKHFMRIGKRNKKLFNIAADIAINQQIKYKLPKGVYTYQTFGFKSNLSTEVYYILLEKEKQKQEQEKKEKEQNGEKWDGPSDGKPDLTNLDEHEGLIDVHNWGEGNSEYNDMVEDIIREVINAAIEKSRGNVPVNVEEIIKLWKKKAVISWKKVLKKYVSSIPGGKTSTIKKRHRRLPHRNELKGKKIHYDKPQIIVGVDVSGSMSNEDIIRGLVEINEVCKQTNSDLYIMQIDTRIAGVELYNPKKKNFKRKAAGGTYMGAAPKYIKENKLKCDVLIMITDGWIENVKTDKNWIDFKKPVIWLTTDVGINKLNNHRVFNIKQA